MSPRALMRRPSADSRVPAAWMPIPFALSFPCCPRLMPLKTSDTAPPTSLNVPLPSAMSRVRRFDEAADRDHVEDVGPVDEPAQCALEAGFLFQRHAVDAGELLEHSEQRPVRVFEDGLVHGAEVAAERDALRALHL